MRREHRLRHQSDFERVRAQRRSWAHPLLVCYASFREDGGPTRVGITVARGVGKAAIRNRVKRRIREAARALYPNMLPGHDLVLVARPPAAEAPYGALNAALASLLARARLRKDTEAAGGRPTKPGESVSIRSMRAPSEDGE